MKEVLIGGIKATLIGENNYEPGSKVLLAVLVHGRTRSKRTTTKFAELLLQSVPNLVCAVWDLPNHGDRTINAGANATWLEGNPVHMNQQQATIDQGATEASTILTYAPLYLPDYEVTSKVIIGTSLGGYIAWKVAAEYSDLITAAIPIISSPDVYSIMESRWRAFLASDEGKNVDEKYKKLAFSDELCDVMKKNAIKTEQLKFSELPIFAICGGDDPLVPPHCTLKWGENMKPNHRVEIVPGVKHDVPREMIDLTAEYLISLASIIL